MNQKTQKKKKNHWVAQAYLRAFSIDPKQKKEKRKIWRFSKFSGDPEVKSVQKVAIAFYLYVPGENGKRDYTFEDRLAELDEMYASSLWDQIANETVDLCNESVRRLTALQMAVMYWRNPAAFDAHKSIHKQIVEFLSQSAEPPSSIMTRGKVYDLDISTWPTFRNASEDDLKRAWLKQIGSATEIAKLFMNMRWSVVVADNPSFITTDNPITFAHPTLEFRGIKNKGTLILFPLSPTRVLLLDHNLTEPDGQYYPLWEGGAAAINSLLWKGASEYMLSSFDTDIVCAQILEFTDRVPRGYFTYTKLKEMARWCLTKLGFTLPR